MHSVYDIRFFVTGHNKQVEQDLQLLVQFSAPHINRFFCNLLHVSRSIIRLHFFHGKEFQAQDLEKFFLKGSRSGIHTKMPIV